jgi:hypothetical protein
MRLREDAHHFFYYIPFLPQYLYFTLELSIFFFHCCLMTLSWKGLLILLTQFFTLFTQSTIRNANISGYFCFALSTGLKEQNSLLLAFFCVRRLCFAHRILLIGLEQISLLRPPKFGATPSGTKGVGRRDWAARKSVA